MGRQNGMAKDDRNKREEVQEGERKGQGGEESKG